MRRLARGLLKLVSVVPVYVVASDYVGTVCAVRDQSMAPTIASDGSSRDFVFVDKFNVWFGKHSKHRPESYYGFLRGEIVFLRSPSEPDEYLLKRVVGLPGDWISSPDGLEIVHVPKGRCWVEGDNNVSNLEGSEKESSSFSSGLVPFGLIQGCVRAIVWPPSRIKELDKKIDLRRTFHTAGNDMWKLKEGSK